MSPNFLIPMLRFFSAVLILTFLSSPTLAFAATQPHTFTTREKERLFRPCKNLDPRKRQRCETRQLKRAEEEWGKSHPTDAFAIYDRFDLGGDHLRARLQEERRVTFQRYWEENRKPLSAFTPEDNLNTRRIPYINTVREERLDCMYVAHGRPRALCFDQQIDRAQKMKLPPELE